MSIGCTNALLALLGSLLGSPAFNPIGDMGIERAGHISILLISGKVLITSSWLNQVELYDASSSTFTLTGSMCCGNSDQCAVLLPNRKVLITGGTLGKGTEIYDPELGTFRTPTRPRVNQETHVDRAVLLNDGRVLITGIENAEIYDPDTDSFQATGSMKSYREYYSSIVLKDGRVLIVSGYTEVGYAPCELYDPGSGAFSYTGDMNIPRMRHESRSPDIRGGSFPL